MMNEKELDKRLEFGRKIANVKPLNEETYDDIDNYLAHTKIGFEEEFRRFMVKMLKAHGRSFAWSFASPESELFGHSWKELTNKYQLMDDAGKEDLYIRIGAYFRQFFLDNFSYAGEQTAVGIAEMFKMMFIQRLRDTQIQARKV